MFKKRATYRSIKKEYLKASEGLDLNKATPLELKRIREQVRQKRKEVFRLRLIAVLIVVPLVLLMGIGLLRTTSFYPASKDPSEEKNQSIYLYLISQGDYFMDTQEWQKAVMRYTRARDLFPEEYAINYRLALAYTYSCYYERINCEAAKFAIARLEEDFKADEKAAELKKFVENR